MWRLATLAACTTALQLPLATRRCSPPHAAARRTILHAVDDVDAELCVALTVHKPPRIDGPNEASPLSPDTLFVSDGAAVLASAATEDGDLIDRAYAAAGPRESILPARTCGIVTCGGLCPGLNTVVQELYCCLSSQYHVDRVWGFEGGYEGLAKGKRVDLSRMLAKKNIYQEGGTLLGTSRPKIPAADLADAVEREELDCLFVVGGDGTMRGVAALSEELQKRDSKCRIAVVPKTIDNDIPLIDRSFGFDTAVTEAKKFIDVASVEARSFPRGVGVVRLMGRDAGFLAVHACLAAPGDVDACLVPEKSFSVDSLIRYVAERLEEKDHCILVVAEGVNTRVIDENGPVTIDEDVGPWLCAQLKKSLPDISLKYVDPSYAVRSAPSSPTDTIFCSRLAQHAVHAVMGGSTAFAVGTVNTHYVEIPLADFEGRSAVCAPTGRIFGDLVRGTGQPSFDASSDASCDDDLESPTGGCVVTWDGPSMTGVKT